ncbi:AEC family transporter [Parapedobacter koreensis]|nr:permease [Parapedobacter koreensis]
MNPAIAKTISLLLLIVVGLSLRKALHKTEHHQALKILILNIALPAIIFVALMNTQMSASLIWLPLLAIVFNFALLGITWMVLPRLYGIRSDGADMRTLSLLIPSLAPGMSCFPFLLEYVGKEAVALGSIADLGNKVYVLIFCYLLAMHWYFKQATTPKVRGRQRLKALLVTLMREPVNLAIFVALLLLGVGWHFQDLPAFMGDPITMLSALMTPIILLFIGITVKFKWAQFRVIVSLLLFRAGITFLLSGLCLLWAPNLSATMAVVAIVFPQSAVSFWPLAHISTISAMEQQQGTAISSPTFNPQLALNVLALSLPFSATIVLAVFSTDGFFMKVPNLFATGGLLLAMAIVPVLLHRMRMAKWRPEAQHEEALDAHQKERVVL